MDRDFQSLQPLTFELLYSQDGVPCKRISVDFVPAFKVIDDNIGKVSGLFTLPEFHQLVVRSNSFLLTQKMLSFTETEVYFMTNVLSTKHRKIYRLLKYLINGHTGEGELHRILRKHNPGFVQVRKGLISSYKIKTLMIFHHYKCKETTALLGPCLIQILSQIKDCFKLNRWYHILECLHNELPYEWQIFISSKSTKTVTQLGVCRLQTVIETLQQLQRGNIEPGITDLDPWVFGMSRDIVLHRVRETVNRSTCVIL